MSGKELPLGGSEEEDETGGSATMTTSEQEGKKEIRAKTQKTKEKKNKPSNKNFNGCVIVGS